MPKRFAFHSQAQRYAQIPKSVLRDPKLKPSDKIVWALLFDAANETEENMPTKAQIADWAGVNPSTVSSCIESLTQNGYIHAQEDVYEVKLPEHAPQNPAQPTKTPKRGRKPPSPQDEYRRKLMGNVIDAWKRRNPDYEVTFGDQRALALLVRRYPTAQEIGAYMSAYLRWHEETPWAAEGPETISNAYNCINHVQNWTAKKEAAAAKPYNPQG